MVILIFILYDYFTDFFLFDRCLQMCPIIPPRDISPPPLPPRRDSLHVRQNSTDSSRFMMSFDPVITFGTLHQSNTISPPSSSDSVNMEKHRFGMSENFILYSFVLATIILIFEVYQ